VVLSLYDKIIIDKPKKRKYDNKRNFIYLKDGLGMFTACYGEVMTEETLHGVIFRTHIATFAGQTYIA